MTAKKPLIIPDQKFSLIPLSLSILSLTPVSFADNWYFLSFQCSLVEDAKSVDSDATLSALQKILGKYEEKLRLSLRCHTSMADNAFRNFNENTDWNHTALMLTVYDRYCWYRKMDSAIRFGRPLPCRKPSPSASSTAWDPTKRNWRDDVQRFSREFGRDSKSSLLESLPSTGVPQELLYVAFNSSSGYRASVESRICLTALGLCSLAVSQTCSALVVELISYSLWDA